MDKDLIRRQVLAMRNALSTGAVAAMSAEIVRRLTDLSEVGTAATLMVYLGFGSEVQTDGLIRWGWAAGKRIAVPLCAADGCLTPCRIEGFEELEKGHYGIREPAAACRRPEALGRIDAVLVPAVAFDRYGYRVGYGGGYYDRFLPRAPRAARIGLAFSGQIVDALPAEAHDVPVDLIVTEEGIIRCRAVRWGI
jgi:5-formyltetrahydrofolate cyclo-ligase